jgi:flagellar assembly factor FliW
MKFTNRQFGELEFDGKHVLDFPDGIIGFGDCKKYLIVDDADTQPFRWLVSLEDPDLSFAMIDPEVVAEGYNSSFVNDKDVTSFLLVALANPVAASTINLRSPLIIKNPNRLGRQVILEDETLSMRYPLFQRRTEQEG